MLAPIFDIALALGLVARLVGLPPLIGFLAAGFVLNGAVFTTGEELDTIADMGVYLQFMRESMGETVVGLDRDLDTVSRHNEAGNKVLLGDVTDSDLWERMQPGRTRLVLLAMSCHEANLLAVKRLAERGYGGRVAATAQFDDELAELRDAGADAAFNFYEGAGAGFAEHAWEQMEAPSG